MSLIVSVVVGSLLSDPTPRHARLLEGGTTPVAQSGFLDPYEPLVPPREALLAERARLVASLPDLAGPISAIVLGSVLLIAAIPFALLAALGAVFFYFAEVAIAGLGGVLITFGGKALSARLRQGAPTRKRIDFIDRELQREAEKPAAATPARWQVIATLAF
jgi:hypothetical protein